MHSDSQLLIQYFFKEKVSFKDITTPWNHTEPQPAGPSSSDITCKHTLWDAQHINQLSVAASRQLDSSFRPSPTRQDPLAV